MCRWSLVLIRIITYSCPRIMDSTVTRLTARCPSWPGTPHTINYNKPRIKPGLHDKFFGTAPVWIWPRCLKFAARHAPFLSCKWKNSWHEYPKTYGGRDYLSTWSRHPYVFGHSCHEFFHLHDKNEGCRAANLEGKRIGIVEGFLNRYCGGGGADRTLDLPLFRLRWFSFGLRQIW